MALSSTEMDELARMADGLTGIRNVIDYLVVIVDHQGRNSHPNTYNSYDKLLRRLVSAGNMVNEMIEG